MNEQNISNVKVSVIIPAYNSGPYIEEMLECVVRQTYRNMEVIIINDGSTDDTMQKAMAFSEKDERIKLINIPNGGVSNARNIGIQQCTGEKIFFWDSDDVVEPETIERCLRFAKENGCNAVLYGYSNRHNNVNGQPHQTIMGGGKTQFSNSEGSYA